MVVGTGLRGSMSIFSILGPIIGAATTPFLGPGGIAIGAGLSGLGVARDKAAAGKNMNSDQLSQGLAGIGGLLQALGIGNNPAEWNQDALINLYNQAKSGDQYGRNMSESMYGPGRQFALDTGNALQRPTLDQAPWLLQGAQDQVAGIPGLLQQFLGNAGDLTPQSSLMQGAADRMGGVANTASSVFEGGGWTPQSQQLFDMLSPLMAGRGSNSQMELDNTGASLLGSRGQTAYTQGIQDRASDAAESGGRNSDLNFAMDRAKETLANQGYTPFGMEQGQQGLGVFNTGSAKALANNLLSPDQAANWGREDATNNIQSQMEAAYRQSQARGGGPGAILASGPGQQMRMDFADDAARLQSEQARKAFMDQEGKMLQDKSIAAGVAGQGAGLAQGAESNAIGRTGQAYAAIPGTQNAATQFMSSLLGAGGDAGSLENSRMQTGGSLASAFGNQQLGAAGQFGNTLANQNQYALGAGNLSNQGSQGQAGIYNQLAQNALGAFGAQTGAQQGAQSNANNIWSQIAQAYQSGVNPLVNYSGQGLDYAGRNVGLMGAPFGNLQGGNAQTSPWGLLGGALGGAIGAIPGGSSGSSGSWDDVWNNTTGGY